MIDFYTGARFAETPMLQIPHRFSTIGKALCRSDGVSAPWGLLLLDTPTHGTDTPSPLQSL